MDKQKIEEIYDRLCMALTAYEANDGKNENPDYDFGYALYSDIVEIVNDMAKELN